LFHYEIINILLKLFSLIALLRKEMLFLR